MTGKQLEVNLRWDTSPENEGSIREIHKNATSRMLCCSRIATKNPLPRGYVHQHIEVPNTLRLVDNLQD